ncbi:zinc finger protein 569-like isoform X2 [Scaptodrosophila lebanonensis]|uniref:Zinc finger protein 569-like isoform X2 n=1 Tax=Drosophila lebanonensis TaxID=7225 RepID=A0A6J2TCF7_DROLE|nr:zinc finger protein 569-like isoform X2 [Scaptodrosophila lebanonensis]
MLSDLLTELTKIEKPPQCVCGDCTRKLIGAYYFVTQAREANSLLLSHLNRSDSGPIVAAVEDCLEEAPMELCPEQHVTVKIEDDRADNDISCIELPEFDLIQQSDVADEAEEDTKKSFDPLKMLDAVKQETDEQRASLLQDEEDSLDEMPLTQRVQRWKQEEHKLKKRFKCDQCPKSFNKVECMKQHSARYHNSKIDWYSCTFCIRKFSRSDGLQAHLKVHSNPKRSSHVADRKKVKDIDVNLCKPHGFKLIQCMICQSKYNRISELRRHLEAHPEPNISNIRERYNLELNELRELFYPDFKDATEDHLQKLMLKDLGSGIYQRFYSITNQSGYEMDLDSSETDSEAEQEVYEQTIGKTKTSRSSSYQCELCDEGYQRKYQLLEHQRQSHAWSEVPHICGRCDARFVSLQILRHHYESQCKNAQKRFLCPKCSCRFRWKHNLKAHLQKHRVIHTSHECQQCNRVFDKKKSLTVHLLSVHADQSKIISCQWCPRKFYRHDYLVKHLKRHGIVEQDIPLAETLIAATSKPNGVKIIKCKICNVQFDRIADLRAHIQLELKLSLTLHQNYESPNNYSIINESGFEMHLDDSETEDETQSESTSGFYKTPTLYVCEICSVQCPRKYEMMQHQRTMHRFVKLPYECDRCIFKCVSKNIMEHHMQLQCQSEEKKHTCKRCSYKFMWPENLELHVRLQHGDKDEGATEQSDPNGNKEAPGTSKGPANVELLQCPHCDRTYQLKSRLNNHIRDVHVNGDRKRKEAMKRFLCSICGKELHSGASLATHMRRHTGEKPFKCDLCDMAFPRYSEMRSHRRMHTGEKPYHCTVCGKDFAWSDKLKRHMLTHSGLKPHKCNYCEKSYRQSKDLNLHLQQHTGECPFVCGTCGERFIQRSSLEKHRMMRRHFDDEGDRIKIAIE